jgi:hypothetical protein
MFFADLNSLNRSENVNFKRACNTSVFSVDVKKRIDQTGNEYIQGWPNGHFLKGLILHETCSMMKVAEYSFSLPPNTTSNYSDFKMNRDYSKGN